MGQGGVITTSGHMLCAVESTAIEAVERWLLWLQFGGLLHRAARAIVEIRALREIRPPNDLSGRRYSKQSLWHPPQTSSRKRNASRATVNTDANTE